MSKKISIIVPCFNEQEVLPIFYEEISKVFASMGCDYELILVNDGSKDDTLAIMKVLSQQDEHVSYLSFSRNFGKESAMYAGLCNAKGDYVAVMDADMQDPPSLLPEMAQLLDSGEYDCIATRRATRAGEPPIRSWFARRFYKIMNLISDATLMDGARDFRLMTREMVDAIVGMSERDRFSKGIFGWVGFRFHWIAYENIERAAGVTKWSFWKLFKYSLDGFVNFSRVPLNIAAVLGVLMCMASFAALIVLAVRSIVSGLSFAGWGSLVSIVSFIGGLILTCIGIMGLYIAKIHKEVKARPHYIISDTNRPDADRIR